MQHGIQLNWQESGPADSYNIKRGLTSGAETQYATAPSTSFFDITGTQGIVYFYKVSAVLAGIESDDSAEVSATFPTVPASPTNLTAKAV